MPVAIAFSLASGFAANGYAAHSPGGYSLAAGLLAEIILTMIFIIVILGSTDDRAPHGFAPIAIGLSLSRYSPDGHSDQNLSVNPARSTGPAVIVAGWALAQLWMFWVAPIAGAAAAALMYNWMARPQTVGGVATTAVRAT